MANTKVVTGKVRLSYQNLLTPREGKKPGDKAKYGTMLLIPKSDKVTVDKLWAAAEEAVRMGIDIPKFQFPRNATAAKMWTTLKDGDEYEKYDPKTGELVDTPEYKGHWYINVTSGSKPGIVGRDRQELLDGSEVYSGQYAKVSIKAQPYNYEGKKAVTFYLENVLILGGGERLGGDPENVSVSAEDEDWGDLDGAELL